MTQSWQRHYSGVGVLINAPLTTVRPKTLIHKTTWSITVDQIRSTYSWRYKAPDPLAAMPILPSKLVKKSVLPNNGWVLSSGHKTEAHQWAWTTYMAQNFAKCQYFWEKTNAISLICIVSKILRSNSFKSKNPRITMYKMDLISVFFLTQIWNTQNRKAFSFFDITIWDFQNQC